jgi:cell wall-associated NlpC family hydrolase
MSDQANHTAQVIVPVLDLLRHPDGPRDRQLLYGETLQVRAVSSGWSHVLADKDGYGGHVPSTSLGPVQPATHWVSAPSSHIYQAPDLKSPDRMALSFGSLVAVLSTVDGYAKTPDGYVPDVHLTPRGAYLSDPLDVAAVFLGTPYLWGGNSRFGLDCSGLVQAAFLACGRSCPGDSGQQEQAFGSPLPVGTRPQRGDLLFWKGHVAMVHDPDTLLHANAFHMAVSYEPLGPALERIEAQGDGKVTSHRRP